MSLDGAKIAILVEDSYQELELWYPLLRATCFFSIKDDLVNAGAQYVDAEVVRDGNLVTSRQPSDLPAFCRTIIAALVEVPAGTAQPVAV
jgi:putative intracellular protease/amidase